MDPLYGELTLDNRSGVVVFLTLAFRFMERDQDVAAFLPVVIHDQVVRDTIQPGSEGNSCGTIVGQADDHTGEYLAGQILGQPVVVHAGPYIPKDMLMVPVVQCTNSTHVAPVGASHQIRVS